MNNRFEEIDPKSLPDNIFGLLDDEWMLVTAGTEQSFNTMTASWGGFGILWQKPIAIIFIRPHRYTYSFVENNDRFTLTFFPDKYRSILNYCGQNSGKDVDKVKESGLTTYKLKSGSISFEEAKIIIECKKMYADDLKPEKFIKRDILQQHYPAKDYHKMFIGEIEHIFIENEFANQ